MINFYIILLTIIDSILVHRKKFDLTDKKHAEVERLFYATIHEVPLGSSLETRVYELFNTLETSKDLLKLKQKQAKKIRWCLHQRNAQQFGGKNPFLNIRNTNEKRKKGRIEMGDQNRKSIKDTLSTEQREKRKK